MSDIAQLNGTITGGNGVIWSSNGSGTFSPSNTTLNATYTPSPADLAGAKVIITLSSAQFDNCNISTSQLTLNFVNLPAVNAGGDQDICNQNTSVKLNGSVSNNVVSALWTSDGTGSFTPSATVAAPTYIMSAADLSRGFVNLTLTASNITCVSTDKAKLTFFPPPVVDAGGKLIYILRNNTRILTPTVDETNVQYLWTPNLYLDNNTVKNPTFTATNDVTYTLKVTDRLGCITTDQLQIIVLDPIVTYNAFSPNADGINDVWNIPAISKYPGAVVDIYNRYGVQLFHSDGYGIPWDGTYKNSLVPFGVYYYVIHTKFSSEVFSGYITVVR